MDARAPRVHSRACMHDAHPTGFSGGLLPASTHPSGQWLARRQPPTTSPSHRAREASSPLLHKRLITPGTRRGVPQGDIFMIFVSKLFLIGSPSPPPPPPAPRLVCFPATGGDVARLGRPRASRPAGSPCAARLRPSPPLPTPLLPAPASVAVGIPASGEGLTDCLPGAFARWLAGAGGWVGVAGRRARTPCGTDRAAFPMAVVGPRRYREAVSRTLVRPRARALASSGHGRPARANPPPTPAPRRALARAPAERARARVVQARRPPPQRATHAFAPQSASRSVCTPVVVCGHARRAGRRALGTLAAGRSAPTL